ncbi:MAG TPA: tRNA (adenosine(37)-N6)-threonylcarbamoyltransferase complex ATPase subunit type 1 TsaE [Armatimonadota bacterium]|nr:tRNA (adenosine(37)-N6)-threonylcarbamoyltransferase complex ATPase subunit type 1 TsaE [Armatimonadota bacterium]
MRSRTSNAERRTLNVERKTTNPEETERLGESIGRALEPGIVVALIGELGAGKTTLTKGIARGLDVPDLVHSPTFTLIHEHKGRLPVYHFDLYRLDTIEQIEDLGYEDYFNGPGVTIVEWAEKIQGLLPDDRLEIRISGEDDARDFTLLATGPNSQRILSRLAA